MKTTYFKLILIVSFLSIILIPNLAIWSNLDNKIDDMENRTLAPFPDPRNTSLDKFFVQLQAFYNDHFGFRDLLIKSKYQLEQAVFAVAGDQDVLPGKNGFEFLIYITAKRPVSNYRTVFFTGQELIRIKNELEAENNWFKQRSIPYFIVIAPDKEAIYPEYFPYPNHILTNLRLDQLINYLKKNSTVQLVDLRQALLNAKDKGTLLYYKRDTHWNEFGAFIAYQEIIRRLSLIRPDIYIPQLSDFNIKTDEDKVPQTDKPGISLTLKPNFPGEDKKLKKVIINGDSFANLSYSEKYIGLMAFLPYSFENVDYEPFITALQKNNDSPSSLNYSKIEQARPDLVIRELVQRHLRLLLGYEYM